MLLLVLLSFLHARQLLMKLSFESLQTNANQSWGLMLVISSSTWSVNLCTPACRRDRIPIQRKIHLHLNKIRLVALKLWSCSIFNEQNQVAKLRASIQQADRRKSTRSVFMVIVLNGTLCSKQLVAFTTFVPVKKFDRLSLKKNFKVVVKRKSWLYWDNAFYEKWALLSLKCGSVKGGDCTRQAIKSKHISEKNCLYRRSLAAENLLEELQNEKLFGYVRFDKTVLKKLRANFANVPLILKNTLVRTNVIGEIMETYAEEEGLMRQTRQMFHLTKRYIGHSFGFISFRMGS